MREARDSSLGSHVSWLVSIVLADDLFLEPSIVVNQEVQSGDLLEHLFVHLVEEGVLEGAVVAQRGLLDTIVVMLGLGVEAPNASFESLLVHASLPPHEELKVIFVPTSFLSKLEHAEEPFVHVKSFCALHELKLLVDIEGVLPEGVAILELDERQKVRGFVELRFLLQEHFFNLFDLSITAFSVGISALNVFACEAIVQEILLNFCLVLVSYEVRKLFDDVVGRGVGHGEGIHDIKISGVVSILRRFAL